MFQPTACTVAGKLEAGNSIPSSWDLEHHTDIPDEGDKHLSSPESKVLINVPAMSFPEGWAATTCPLLPMFLEVRDETTHTVLFWLSGEGGHGALQPRHNTLPTWQDGCWASASHRDAEKVAAGHRIP